MGGDGGSIAGRSDLVVVKKKPEVLEKDLISLNRWLNCALSQNPLDRHPGGVVCCELGNLYNKTALIEHLLSKKKLPAFSHVRNLKDVTVCKLKWSEDAGESAFVCPITAIPAKGKHKFFCTRPCGCVISEKALKEVRPSSACLVCGSPLASDPYIPINPEDDDEIEVLRQKLATSRANEPEKKTKRKRDKSSKNGKEQEKERESAEDSNTSSTSAPSSSSLTSSPLAKPVRSPDRTPTSSTHTSKASSGISPRKQQAPTPSAVNGHEHDHKSSGRSTRDRPASPHSHSRTRRRSRSRSRSRRDPSRSRSPRRDKHRRSSPRSSSSRHHSHSHTPSSRSHTSSSSSRWDQSRKRSPR